jgi:hypothetical protein
MNAIPDNPFRRLASERAWSVNEQAQALGIPAYRVRALYNGNVACLLDAWRPGFEAADLDFDALRVEYASWRDRLFGGGPVPNPDPARLSDPERAIAAALAAGYRGLNAIAHAAKVPRATVQDFLKTHTFRVG